ncbi:MAG: HEPN domain-containing protein, partial [Spirochaetaceae bacterium]|nr:HEPN domain-containing protein [Spirochaetaceae bacterium]
FCCQQALEKLVKGLYLLYLDDNIPKIHNINTLIDRFSDKLTEEIDERWRNLFDRVTNFYISGRYPKYISSLGSVVNKAQAGFVLKESKEAFEWLLTLKPQIK